MTPRGETLIKKLRTVKGVKQVERLYKRSSLVGCPAFSCVTTARLKQRQWTVCHARCRAKCRQRSRQNTDNKLQNRLPSLPFHRLKI